MYPFPAQKRKISQGRKNPYLLERNRIVRKPRGHFLNLKPQFPPNSSLGSLAKSLFLVHTHSSRQVDGLSLLARRILTDESPRIAERSPWLSSFSPLFSHAYTTEKECVLSALSPLCLELKSWPMSCHMSTLARVRFWPEATYFVSVKVQIIFFELNLSYFSIYHICKHPFPVRPDWWIRTGFGGTDRIHLSNIFHLDI